MLRLLKRLSWKNHCYSIKVSVKIKSPNEVLQISVSPESIIKKKINKIKKKEWLEFSKKSTEHLRIFNFLTKDQSF